MAAYLDVDLNEVTHKLISTKTWSTSEFADSQSDIENEQQFNWMGHPLEEDVRIDGLDTYHGDFRKRGVKLDSRAVYGSGCSCGDH